MRTQTEDTISSPAHLSGKFEHKFFALQMIAKSHDKNQAT
jgi:hypothetical protein